MKGVAEIDATGRYRYTLRRTWESHMGAVAWIMLNPSTADAETDDATIRRCIGFSSRWNYGGLCVVNLFAYRATDPRRLLTVRQSDAIGTQNDEWIGRVVRGASLVVVAWGARGGMWGRDREVLDMLAVCHVSAMCLGVTQDGAPRHPLRLAYTTPLVEFRSR